MLAPGVTELGLRKAVNRDWVCHNCDIFLTWLFFVSDDHRALLFYSRVRPFSLWWVNLGRFDNNFLLILASILFGFQEVWFALGHWLSRWFNSRCLFDVGCLLILILLILLNYELISLSCLLVKYTDLAMTTCRWLLNETILSGSRDWTRQAVATHPRIDYLIDSYFVANALPLQILIIAIHGCSSKWICGYWRVQIWVAVFIEYGAWIRKRLWLLTSVSWLFHHEAALDFPT